jgi:hypothetical protein
MAATSLSFSHLVQLGRHSSSAAQKPADLSAVAHHGYPFLSFGSN